MHRAVGVNGERTVVADQLGGILEIRILLGDIGMIVCQNARTVIRAEESGSEVVLSLLSVVLTPLIMLLMLSVTNPVMKNAQRPKTTSAMMKVAQKLRSEFIPSLTFYGFDRRSAKSCQSHNIIPYCSAFFNI